MRNPAPTSKTNSKELTYVLTEERGVPSFSPIHSDTLLNASFLEQLVGTLVKYAFDGKAENCLADSWRVSEGGLRYAFRIREGVRCEDGTAITADSFHKNLLRLFRLYTKANKDIPVFEQLEGFGDFRSGVRSDIPGIKTDANMLEFHFSKNPDGLLEFLSMPYYGFYCDSNFKPDGAWKDPRKIISSGPWRLESFRADSVRMAKRSDWFHRNPDEPDFVDVKMLPFSAAKKLPPVRTIINKRIEEPRDVPLGYRKFLGTPTDLISVVLSPYRDGPFKFEGQRRSFQKAVQEAMGEKKIESEISRNTVSFYAGQKTPVAKDAGTTPVDPARAGKRQLKAVTSNALTPAQLSYVKEILSASAGKIGMSIGFEGEDRTKPGWKERLDELEDMDIRVVRVDIGGSYEPWVVRMMFCSRLGVSFPDPSGRIAQLTQDMTDRRPATAAAFEKIVSEDAAVIPIFHSAFSWMVSDDIGMDRFSPTANLLRFEMVQIR